ncbi:MAG: hypothetical protein MI923_28215 [Phycisphaerales bacterium]|nr:hypothetical protein [Phycisphaerales bacterium]
MALQVPLPMTKSRPPFKNETKTQRGLVKECAGFRIGIERCAAVRAPSVDFDGQQGDVIV